MYVVENENSGLLYGPFLYHEDALLFRSYQEGVARIHQLMGCDDEPNLSGGWWYYDHDNGDGWKQTKVAVVHSGKITMKPANQITEQLVGSYGDRREDDERMDAYDYSDGEPYEEPGVAGEPGGTWARITPEEEAELRDENNWEDEPVEFTVNTSWANVLDYPSRTESNYRKGGLVETDLNIGSDTETKNGSDSDPNFGSPQEEETGGASYPNTISPLINQLRDYILSIRHEHINDDVRYNLLGRLFAFDREVQRHPFI